ncbi:GNAT family N-acetyltransferase [Candidatus Poribacteria bacterium]|nr:GNAT family N-acetyltransferase [Candidatus Poribacteria bacterium]MYA58576.1 GNAT family N-acetyltransferase [Candidatus Poribacteria bacterium]
MEIRGAYESELEQVVELCCLAFNPDGHERYWQYIRGDNSYRLPQTRVVVVNDTIVSTLRVWERRIRVGASLITMGGIGGVCTHPKYRGVGYASALMQDTIDYLRMIGCDIGALFSIIPEGFYRRLRWTSFPLYGFQLTLDSVTPAEAPVGWQVTNFNPETDLDAVAALHDRANAQQSGTIARTRAYWDMAPSRIRGVLPTVVARRDEHIGGYLNYEIDEKTVEVREVGCIPNNPEVLEALVSHFLRVCKAQGVEKIEGAFSVQHPFAERLMARCHGELTPIKDAACCIDAGMMFYAVNLPVFLRRLVVGWESRIADAEETFPPLTVKLPPLNNQQAALRHNADGTLQIVPENTDTVDLRVDLTEADFWQLLFGEIGWEQINSGASVSPEISAFLGTLFPKRDVIFWSPDRY